MEKGKQKRSRVLGAGCWLVMLFLLCSSAPDAAGLKPGATQEESGVEGPHSIEGSVPEAVEAIQRARVVTRVLYVTAHPDDEGGSVGMLAYLSRGLGAEVAILSITRGEGGQNAIGPEYGGKLAILRSEELQAACRSYGVELFFTRAADFGFSKTTEETMRVWGDPVIQDMKEVIGHFRPHIIMNNWGGVRGGHGHHVTAGILTARVFEEMQRGDGWRPRVLLNPTRGNTGNDWEAPSDQVSPLWGRTYNEFGVEGFVKHRTQGIAGFRTSPFFRSRRGVARVAGDAFKPEMLAEPITALGSMYPKHAARLAEAEKHIAAAKESALRLDWGAAAVALARAGKEIEAALEEFGRTESGKGKMENGSWELRRVKRNIDEALAAATALRVVARADRGEAVAGESFTVRAEWQGRDGVPLKIGAPEIVVPEQGWKTTLEEKSERGARYTVAVPALRPDESGLRVNSWMRPEPPPLVQAGVRASVDGYEFAARAPVTAQRISSTQVEEAPLVLVPAVTITLEPRSVVILSRKMEIGKGKMGEEGRSQNSERRTENQKTTPEIPRSARDDKQKQVGQQIEVLARVHYYGTAAAEFAVSVEAPAGWRNGAGQTVKFAAAGDQLVRLTVTPPAQPEPGNFALRAVAKRASDGAEFRTSLEPLPSLPTRLWSEPAMTAVRVLDLNVPAGLRVGYIAAENDPIPDVLRQIGVQVEMLDEVALAFGDLSRFDAIAVGIRAYELRRDLIRSNARLLEYVAAGGTVVVQYQRDDDWNRLKPAPYAASVGQPTIRVSVEDSPVRLLAPAHAVLNFPNKIMAADFNGWVQERGLYFWGAFDAKYEPILGMKDPGEEETRGGLVYARHGKGVYVYTALSFFRQLPEGVPGAFRLFVNLLSQGRSQKTESRSQK
jgi:LmbE family N-acetylglucosaminyl deacetylase